LGAALDELAGKLWRAHEQGHLADAEAEAISEAVEARRAVLAGFLYDPKPAEGRPWAC
jgi:hypothetical protein